MKIENVILTKREPAILTTALARIMSRGLEVFQQLRDKEGIYGYILSYGYVLVAKRYIYKGFVSCHKTALEIAYRHRRALLMYISEKDDFLVFSPSLLMERYTENEMKENKRTTTIMVNFCADLGKWLSECGVGYLIPKESRIWQKDTE